jgi:Spy/CpxP family protein refolding chaperone
VSAAARIAGILLLTGLVGAAGGWIGIEYGLRRATAPASDFHEVLHNDLGLTPDQERRIADLEAEFAQTRKTLDAEMVAANRELADAILAESTYGDQAKRAIERFHDAMGRLQEETIKHILAMREVLTPEQAEIFDRTVSKALASAPP